MTTKNLHPAVQEVADFLNNESKDAGFRNHNQMILLGSLGNQLGRLHNRENKLRDKLYKIKKGRVCEFSLGAISNELKEIEQKIEELKEIRKERYTSELSKIHPFLQPAWISQYNGTMHHIVPFGCCRWNTGIIRERSLLDYTDRVRSKFETDYPNLPQSEYELATLLLNTIDGELIKIHKTWDSIHPLLKEIWLRQQDGILKESTQSRHSAINNSTVNEIMSKFDVDYPLFSDQEYLDATTTLNSVTELKDLLEKEAKEFRERIPCSLMVPDSLLKSWETRPIQVQFKSGLTCPPPCSGSISNEDLLSKIHPFLRDIYNCQVSGKQNIYGGVGTDGSSDVNETSVKIVEILRPFMVIYPCFGNDVYLEASRKLFDLGATSKPTDC